MVARTSLLIVLAATSWTAYAQTSTFIYQGHLVDNGARASGVYNFDFALFDMPAGGQQQAAAISRQSVVVSNGLFSVDLDFGAEAFTGAPRWLELTISKPEGAGAAVTLAPRQPVNSTPYALRAATTSTYAGSVADAQLSTNVALLNANQVFSGNPVFEAAQGNFSGTFSGNGAGLTNLPNSGGAGGFGAFTGRINQLPTSASPMFGAPSGFSDAGPNETGLTTLSPGRDIIARDLSVRLSAAPGTGRSLIFTLRVDGQDTPVSCTVSGSNVAANSGLAFAAIPAGSTMSLRVNATGAPSVVAASFGWSFE